MSGTLPPGIYKIRHSGVNFATNPPNNGLSISFRGEIPAGDAAKTQQASLLLYLTTCTSASNWSVIRTMQWQVSAHGVITSMATKTTFVWSVTSSTPCAHVIRNSDRYEWIVRAE